MQSIQLFLILPRDFSNADYYPEIWDVTIPPAVADLLSACTFHKNSSFSRNGPVAASPCKGMGQWQLSNPAKGEFASKKCSNMF
jgi:hypothetical protein